MIIRSTIKNIYYPRPEKGGRIVHRSGRIRYVHGALVVQSKG